MYRRMKTRPSNSDLPQERATKERALSRSFMQYLAGTGPFSDWKDQRAGFEDIMVRTSYDYQKRILTSIRLGEGPTCCLEGF